jgi:hypothetical protein
MKKTRRTTTQDQQKCRLLIVWMCPMILPSLYPRSTLSLSNRLSSLCSALRARSLMINPTSRTANHLDHGITTGLRGTSKRPKNLKCFSKWYHVGFALGGEKPNTTCSRKISRQTIVQLISTQRSIEFEHQVRAIKPEQPFKNTRTSTQQISMNISGNHIKFQSTLDQIS